MEFKVSCLVIVFDICVQKFVSPIVPPLTSFFLSANTNFPGPVRCWISTQDLRTTKPEGNNSGRERAKEERNTFVDIGEKPKTSTGTHWAELSPPKTRGVCNIITLLLLGNVQFFFV